MKLNINTISCAAIAAIAIASASCNSMLDKYPTSSISENNFWLSESDALMVLNGCYKFGDGWANDTYDAPQGLMYFDLCGGHGSEKEGFTTDMAGSHTIATNEHVGLFWNNCYYHIAQCNTFLDNIVNCPMDEKKKTEMTAEVKVIRAYYFLKLAFYWKDVPMPLKTLTLEEANSIGQTPQADVYAQLINDCKESINNLPDTRSDTEFGRVTKGVARAIMGRAYLGQDKWKEAAEIYKDIITSGAYKLNRSGDDPYASVFRLGGEYTGEPIFFSMNLKDKVTNVHTVYKTPERMGGWHQFAINNELVKDYFCADGKSIEDSPLYNDEDPYANRESRLYSSIFLPPVGSYPGTVYNGKVYDCFNGSEDYYNKYVKFNGLCPFKGLDENMGDIWGNYVYTPFIRYAEVLISYIEAVNEYAPGSVDQAMLDLTINDIRTRAGLPGYKKDEVASQDVLRKAIRKERRVELAFEGLRYFDVLRWGTAMKELNHYFTGVKLSKDPNAHNFGGTSPVDENGYYQYEQRSWSEHNRYFPIPQADLNVNKNLKQNEGYN